MGSKVPDLKQKAKKEFRRFMFYFFYLALFFCSFILYTNLIVSNFTHASFHYSFGLIEAFIIAKVIMIGQALHLGEGRFATFPLMIPTLYKSLIFSLLVFAFAILEHFLGGYLHGKNIEQIAKELINVNINEILIRTWVKFIAFIPFFAFLELEEILGEGKIYELFFKQRQ
jgi:hypothetical protein